MDVDKTTKPGDGGQTQLGQNLQAGSEQTSTAEQLTSSIEEGKQYGGADVKKLVEDALSADGREQKDRADKAEGEVKRLTDMANGLTTQYNTVSAQVAELLKASNEAEADKVKEDPVALASLRARQANAAEALRIQGMVADYEAKNTALTARETEVNTKLTSVNIKLAATVAGVDEKTLADLVPDGDPERLKKMSGILKQSGQTNTQQLDEQGRVKVDKDGKEIPVALRQKPASTVSAGGDAKTTAERMLEKAKGK